MQPNTRRAWVLAGLTMVGAAMAQTAPVQTDAAGTAPAAAKDSSTLCHIQVPPEMPRQALLDGVEGTVRASATVRKGVVQDVQILSGPEAYHQAVKNAMAQYVCEPSDAPQAIHQEFKFVINTEQRTLALCPVQYRPYMPKQALQQGISSRVMATARIENGEVTRVDISRGHRVYWEVVKAAMMKYQCLPMTTEFTQEFLFQIH